MNEKKEVPQIKSQAKKNFLVPVIILAVILLIVGVILVQSDYFGDESAKEDAKGDGAHSDPSDLEDGTGDANGKEGSELKQPSSTFDVGEQFFDLELEEEVYNWISEKMEDDDFILLEIINMPEEPEAFEAYKDEQIFVYRSEISDGGRSVLIGEPFSDAFFRLKMEKDGDKWVITEEIDLW